MKRAGCKGEKITFIFDESNILGVAFLERMNAYWLLVRFLDFLRERSI